MSDRRTWFDDARLGTFDPTQWDAEALASMARDAGMRYAVFTGRNHSGLAMFNPPGLPPALRTDPPGSTAHVGWPRMRP